MAAIEVTKKLLIYHTLYRLNLSFSNIVTHCRTLQDTGILSAKFGRLFQGLTRELQAELNQEMLGEMQDLEMRDWRRFGKVRQAWEKELGDPNDVLITAAERKRQITKERKNKRHKK
jgi:hypothetical protein